MSHGKKRASLSISLPVLNARHPSILILLPGSLRRIDCFRQLIYQGRYPNFRSIRSCLLSTPYRLLGREACARDPRLRVCFVNGGFANGNFNIWVCDCWLRTNHYETGHRTRQIRKLNPFLFVSCDWSDDSQACCVSVYLDIGYCCSPAQRSLPIQEGPGNR